MGAENCVEDTGEEGNRPLGKVLQCPVQYAVRAQSFVNLRWRDLKSKTTTPR